MLEVLLKLLRIAIGTESPNLDTVWREKLCSFGVEDWKGVKKLAVSQNVAAVAMDGFNMFFESAKEESNFSITDTEEDLSLLEWGYSAFMVSNYFQVNIKVLTSLSKLYSDRGINTLALKGYGLSLEYPIPSHRCFRDLDIFLFGKWKEGSEIAEKEFDVKINTNSDKHNIFRIEGVPVENHLTFLNSGRIPELEYAEKRLSELAADSVRDEQTGCLLPSVQFNAIFVPLHFAMHYVFRGAALSHLLDWAVFLKAHAAEIDWEDVFSIADKVGCRTMIESMNRIAVQQFGIPGEGIPFGKSAPIDAETLLNEVLLPIPPIGGSIFRKMKKFRIWRRRYRTVYKGTLLRYLIKSAK